MMTVPVDSETGSILNGIARPLPFSQLMPIRPVRGTLSCMSSVGMNVRMIIAESPGSIPGICAGVADFIQLGSANVIMPVLALPMLVI